MKGLNIEHIIDRSLAFYTRRSFYVHLTLVCSLLLLTKAYDVVQTKILNRNLKLIEASVRVDVVAMPKYTLKELQNLSEGVENGNDNKNAENLKQVEAKEEKVAEKPTEEVKEQSTDESLTFNKEGKQTERKSFLNMLQKVSKEKVEGQKNKQGLYGKEQGGLKELILQGNKLSRGTLMYGDSNGKEMTEFQVYLGRLPQIIRPHWKLPSFLLDKKLRCRVRIWLAPSGELIRAEIYQTSGDDEYDQRAVEAVRIASPYPQISKEYAQMAQNGEILLGFPL